MRKLILIAQTSLDGFVAGVHGEFDHFIGGDENLGFVCSITDDSDTILLGRISFQLLNNDWPNAARNNGATKNMIKYSNWYNASKKFVVSSNLKTIDSGNIKIICKNIAAEITDLKNQQGKDILIFGSPHLVHSLLELNLLDSFWLVIHPVLFGNGIPLFRNSEKVTKLRSVASKQLSDGTFCHKYVLNKT
ncbi:MAG: dihydrofolate reductase family protein [Ferruginibacter sp.]